MRNLLRWILKIVIQRDGIGISSLADSHQECVVLTEIAHQPDTAHPPVFLSGSSDHRPASIGAPIVDENDLVRAEQRERRRQPGDEQREYRLRSMHWDNGRYPGRETAP